MTYQLDENLKQNIKKNIYGKAQSAKIIFPAGFGAIALDEAKSILNNLWAAKKFTGEIVLSKNEIQIRPVYLFAIIELLLRNHCFTDVRLIVFKGAVIGKKAFEKKCREVCWNYYLNKTMTIKIKVNSVASVAFHETGLKEILTDILTPYVSAIVSGDNANETTCLYAELYKDKLTLSISLAGQPLYKRGYRGMLGRSAPLREDIAACCIRKAFMFSQQYEPHFLPKTIFIPFSGTGTFAFEYFRLNPIFLGRDYALQQMPLFRKSNFDLLVNTIKEHYLCSKASLHIENSQILCVDSASDAISALFENENRFKNAIEKLEISLPDIVNRQSDFFEVDFDKLSGNIFIPLNPPYGIRLHQDTSVIVLYKKIAIRLNEIIKVAQKNQCSVLGFVLCPTEESWSALIGNLRGVKAETYHFTQGGLDIRVCQFFVSHCVIPAA